MKVIKHHLSPVTARPNRLNAAHYEDQLRGEKEGDDHRTRECSHALHSAGAEMSLAYNKPEIC